MSGIEAFRDRLALGGDLNSACMVLEELKDQTCEDSVARRSYNMIMDLITIGTRSHPAPPSFTLRLLDKAIETFKKHYGDDDRFTALIEAIEEAAPKYKEHFGTTSPDNEIGI